MLNLTSYSLVTKSSRKLAPATNENGQISIFFSASLVVLITVIAFVINIGLFVKAKINLQNATDAAAFSGAAVQARQLTTIGHLNWEMRNIYKEWMFKYYVVGNLNIEDVEDPSAISGNAVSFRLRPTTNPLEPDPNRRLMKDQYNFPSVCIHLAGSQTNLCKRYSVPGLPEFGSSGLPGAEQASRAFINTLIGTKVLDCIDQTKLNMLVNLTWAYNVFLDTEETIVQQGPQILADRMGAWPKAVEVAMRIRNLERAVNREAMNGGVCATQQSGGGITCRRTIDSVMSDKALGNERVMKAFFSGYRNIGGGDLEDEMKASFTLTEIPPTTTDLGGSKSASYLLVPEQKAQQYKKPYLDLHLMMVNYATFYNAFIPRASANPGAGDTDIKGTSGACDVSKVAMPVPGYPMGFYKNPDVLTYYAVKGEAQFTGMFNPFTSDQIKLTAYSAAKPFGGRVGPMLFLQPPNQEYYVGRNDPTKRRSVPYIASLEFQGTKHPLNGTNIALGEFAPGIPLPINFDDSYFWLRSEDSPLGGYIAGGDVQFGLPNLVYDYQTGFTSTGYTSPATKINTIFTRNPEGDDKAIGLFSKFQLQQFKGTALNAQVSQDLLAQEIRRVRAPTNYESANYLIPSPDTVNQRLGIDSVGFVPGPKSNLPGVDTYQVPIYAPLYSGDQTDVLWTNPSEVVSTVFEFLRAQKSGIDKYRKSMIKAAITINKMGDELVSDASGAKAGFTRAANGVADVPDLNNLSATDQQIQSCESLAGVFLFFYYGDNALEPNIVANRPGCPQTLGENLRKYFGTNNPANGGFSPTHYLMDYSFNPAMRGAPNSLFSAYMPGTFTGVAGSGVFSNPIAGSDVADETMRRNFYSTKFVQLRSLTGAGPWNENSSNFVIMSEGSLNNSGPDARQEQYKNPLDAQSVGVDVNAIRY